MNNETLATELLHEVKASAKRWFIAFIVMCTVEVFTIVGFLIYLCVPVEEYNIEQNANTNGGSVSNQSIGGDINGKGVPESNLQKTENDDR